MSRFVLEIRKLLVPLGDHTPAVLSVRLALALSLSLAFHAGIWLGVKVAPPTPSQMRPALNVTLVATPPGRSEPTFMLPPYLSEPAQDTPPQQLVGEQMPNPVPPQGPLELTGDAAPATQLHEQGAIVVARPNAVFYSATEVDRGAVFLNDVKPEYPPQAHADGIEGHVDVRVFIDEAGFVRDVTIDAASPPGFFEQAAIFAFRAARFTPAYKNEQPVKSQKKIRIWFGLNEGEPP